MDLRHFVTGSPKNILSIIITVSVVLLLLWLLVIARMDYGSQTETTDPVDHDRLESVRTMKGETGNEMPVVDQRPSSLFTNAVTTFMVMIALLAIVWFWSKRRSGTMAEPGKRFNELDVHILGPGQFLKVMEINDEIWILGVGSGAVNLLHRYDKNEWKERSAPIEQPVENQGFLKMFKGFSQ